MYDEFDNTVWKLFTSTGQIGYYMFLTDLKNFSERDDLKDLKE